MEDIDIKVDKQSHKTISLSWKAPEDDGGLPQTLKYDVDCGVDCKLIFTPRKKDLTNTQVTISDLIPGKQYIFKVFSKNKISEQFGNGSYKFENQRFTLPNG